MDPVTAHVLIDRPREEVFDYLVDIANHPEFSDHYLKEWRLTRVESVGRGAGARFKIDAPLDRYGWGDMTFIEVERPHRIVAAGRGGEVQPQQDVDDVDAGALGRRDPRRGHDRERAGLPTDKLMEAVTRPPRLDQARPRQGAASACSRSSRRGSTAAARHRRRVVTSAARCCALVFLAVFAALFAGCGNKHDSSPWPRPRASTSTSVI